MKEAEKIKQPTQRTSQRKPSNNSANVKASRASWVLIGAGSSFAGMILAGFIVGYFIDKFFDSLPIALIFCGFMGLYGAFSNLNKMFGMSASATNSTDQLSQKEDKEKR